MSVRYWSCLAACAALAGPAAPAAAETNDPAELLASKLLRNPFERPDFSTVPEPEPVKAPVIVVPPPWTPELKATVFAPAGASVVNVEGVILGIGQEYQGYTLIEVGERRAVFEREGERHMLSMD